MFGQMCGYFIGHRLPVGTIAIKKRMTILSYAYFSGFFIFPINEWPKLSDFTSKRKRRTGASESTASYRAVGAKSTPKGSLAGKEYHTESHTVT